MAENKNSTVDVPPVFIGLDDLESKGVFKGPWEKEETMNMFSNLLESNRIGVSSDPRSGAFLEHNVEMALRSSPGNVEVGILHKEGHKGNQGVGWTEASLEQFANSASLFMHTPETNPTVHAPVDVNWFGLELKDNKIELSDDAIEKELNWLKEQVIPKAKPFANVIAIKKEEGYLDKNFRMPIVFHSTPALGIYGQGPLDIKRTTKDIIYDVKGNEEVFRGNLEVLAKTRGYEMPELKSGYNVNGREEVKEELLKEIEESLENKIRKSTSDLVVSSKKLESTEKLISDLYGGIEKIDNPLEGLKPKEETEELVYKLEETLGSSINLTKLEEGGVSLDTVKSFLEQYKLYKDNFNEMSEEERKKEQDKLVESFKELKEEIKRAKESIVPIQKKDLLMHMGERLKDLYKRLGEKEKVKEIDNLIQGYNKDDSLYKKFQKELEEVSKKIKDKKLVELRPMEEVALEKASDSIAKFAIELAKDPTLREHSFVAIENFFPEDFFAGKIKKDGKEEWAMKLLIEEARNKFKEKAIKEGLAKDKKEAEQLAKDLIGMTLDMGHFNLWRSRGMFKNEEEFLEMTKDFVKSVAPFVRHIHLTDNPGTEDTHQEIGTGNVPNELAFDILREVWEKEGINPTITIEWGGPEGLANKQPSNYVNWKAAVDPVYGRHRTINYSNLYHSFSYNPTEGFYYKQKPYLTSWLT